jgi:hypothetical protein
MTYETEWCAFTRDGDFASIFLYTAGVPRLTSSDEKNIMVGDIRLTDLVSTQQYFDRAKIAVTIK